jgi:dimethylhistidine N-methyltransferase
MSAPARERFTLVATGGEARAQEFAALVRAGLGATPKWLPCRYFYDREGSRLFEEICQLEEYYLTRAEREILQASAAEIAARFPAGTILVELGSGSAAKTRLLIEAFLAAHGGLRYIPIDISCEMLEESSLSLLEDFPGLRVDAICGEYREALRHLREAPEQPRLVLWMGSNVGNFDRPEAAVFLGEVVRLLGPADGLLLGVDLRKDRAVLERAYDDSRGVTARFNLNLLARVNRELGGRFDLGAFRHRAVYAEGPGRVEMYLVAVRPHRVRIEGLSLEVSFLAGEAIHTESSYKYALTEIDALARAAGFRPEARWLDAEGRFAVDLWRSGG